MVKREVLISQLDAWLQPKLIKDYCPNGLQVEGTGDVGKIVCGVTACEALLDAAIGRQADMVLVHHGYFWKGESAVIQGMKKRRLGKLLRHDISLVAYHLPLDIHVEYGNNAQLAKVLGLSVDGQVAAGGTDGLLWYGQLPKPMQQDELRRYLFDRLARDPLIINGSMPAMESKPWRTIAWCTGGAQGFIDDAADLGVDLYLSGEVSEQTVHSARELGISYIAAGHHATERYGIQALGNAVAAEFPLDVSFVDIDNPA